MRGLGVVLPLALAGCNTAGEYVSSYEAQPGLIMHSYSDDLQTAFVKQNGSAAKVCLEPAPDVAAGGGATLAVNDGVGDAVNASESRTVTALGGRSDLTLVTREMLYRACELAVNNNLSPAQTVALYKSTLHSITAIAKEVEPPQINTTYPQPSL